MTTWQLELRRGWTIGLAFIVLLIALGAGLITLAVLNPLSILTFLLGLGALGALGVALVLGYWLWNFIHASYELDRNALVIHWGNYEQQIPLGEVRQVLRGSELEDLRFSGVVRWPGYCVGWGESPATGPIHFYASRSLDEQILVVLEERAYALSPADPEAFLEALEERREMGPTQALEFNTRRPNFYAWELWRDPWALLPLSISLLLLILAVGLLTLRYPTLPSQIVLQFDTQGQPLLTAQRSRIFYLALVGAVFLLVNGIVGVLLYRRWRIVSYFLWIGLVILQTSLWIAILTILLNA